MAGNIAYVEDERISIQATQLANWTADTSTGVLMISGQCPSCGHDTSSEIPLEIVVNAAGTDAATTLPPEKRTTRKVSCVCTVGHSNRPTTVLGGCGRWWLVTLARDDEHWRILPGGDERLLPALEALDAAGADDQAAVRAVAEKWLPGVTALYGLFGLAATVAGKDAVKDLALWPKLVAAGSVVAGLVLTAFAITTGYKAAFGWPSLANVSTDDKVLAWYLARAQAAATNIRQLKVAVFLAFAAVGCLVAAVGTIWFGPRSSPASPTVIVTYHESGKPALESTVCGSLIVPERGGLSVRAKTSSGTAVTVIKAEWVVSVKPTTSCA